MKAKLVAIPTILNEAGNLSVLELNSGLEFEPKRAYFLHGVPGQATRGGHAHRELRQFIVAVNGSLVVKLDDGFREVAFTLNNPQEGLAIEPGLWRELTDFSAGAVCLVLASAPYDEEDYIRNYKDFLEWSAAQI